ncbi:MAG: hypothetical protein AABX59_04030, partial [Nanoarchaeota archaeon]
MPRYEKEVQANKRNYLVYIGIAIVIIAIIAIFMFTSRKGEEEGIEFPGEEFLPETETLEALNERFYVLTSNELLTMRFTSPFTLGLENRISEDGKEIIFDNNVYVSSKNFIRVRNTDLRTTTEYSSANRGDLLDILDFELENGKAYIINEDGYEILDLATLSREYFDMSVSGEKIVVDNGNAYILQSTAGSVKIVKISSSFTKTTKTLEVQIAKKPIMFFSENLYVIIPELSAGKTVVKMYLFDENLNQFEIITLFEIEGTILSNDEVRGMADINEPNMAFVENERIYLLGNFNYILLGTERAERTEKWQPKLLVLSMDGRAIGYSNVGDAVRTKVNNVMFKENGY